MTRNRMPHGRAQEMARTSNGRRLDAGITGHDWVVETGRLVEELSELNLCQTRLARVRWVLAVRRFRDSKRRRLEGKVIATEVVRSPRLPRASWRKSTRWNSPGERRRYKSSLNCRCHRRSTETGASLRGEPLLALWNRAGIRDRVHHESSRSC